MLRTRIAIGVVLVFLLPTTARAQTAPARTDAQRWPENPATAADPPLLAPPSSLPPTSISGTDVTPSGNLLPMGAGAVGERSSDDAKRLRELEMRVAIDEARLKKLENDLNPLRNVTFMGYVQLQYLVISRNTAASPNIQPGGALPPNISPNDVIAKPDGTTTNTNGFRLRRTRLGATYETDVVRVFLQLDLLPSGGPVATRSTIARNAEVTGIAHWSKDVRTEFTGGLMIVPFSLELGESAMDRPFIEPTWASLNLFPSERDLGVHAKTIAWGDRLVVDAGILNGQRLGEPKFAIQPDLKGSKDFFATVAMKKLGPAEVSLSGYYGRGQVVDPTLLRVKNYERYAGNLGARVAHAFFPMLGETRLVGEILFGKNMDTGVVYPFAVPAIPQELTDDVKGYGERGIYLRAEQELTHWAIAGFRFDTYTADVAQQNNARDTYTFMAGARLSKHLRLINELAYAIDNMHPGGAAAPSKHIVQFSSWLQGTF